MDIAKRFASNPLLTPAQVKPSAKGLQVTCLLNPGAFRYKGRTGLLMRVAERQVLQEGCVGTAICDDKARGGLRFLQCRRDDPELSDAGVHTFTYRKEKYLTTLSHLRLAWSDDGEHFVPEETATLIGAGPYETFGMEDVRVSQLGETYHLTYTQVSECGIGVGHITTRNWRTFRRHGMIIPPQNKDCAIFERKVGADYVCLHRPMQSDLGGLYIWTARSRDLVHWGRHTCIARTRPGQWDEERIGAGAAPIWTREGWLEIYHGCDRTRCYRLGALLLDKRNPEKVLARSRDFLMEPTADYEKKGFFGNCVFTNGHVVDGDRISVYYGAADSVICGANLSIREILATLK